MNAELPKSDAAWKTWLRGRLLGDSPLVPPVDRRRDEDPFDEPARLWKTANEDIRIPLKRAILELLEEAAAAPWPAEPAEQLTRLIETIELWEAVGRLESIVGRRPDNPLQIRALRTLLGLGWRGTPEFWEHQVPTLGRQWPALVFSGLAGHGLDMAFRHLPQLAHNASCMRDILDLWPSMVRLSGQERLREAAVAVLPRLSPAAVEPLRPLIQATREKPSAPAVLRRAHRLLRRKTRSRARSKAT